MSFDREMDDAFHGRRDNILPFRRGSQIGGDFVIPKEAKPLPSATAAPKRLTVHEAIAALARARSATRGNVSDALCSVWFKDGRVTVFAPGGTGDFSREEWEAAGGPVESLR